MESYKTSYLDANDVTQMDHPESLLTLLLTTVIFTDYFESSVLPVSIVGSR